MQIKGPMIKCISNVWPCTCPYMDSRRVSSRWLLTKSRTDLMVYHKASELVLESYYQFPKICPSCTLSCCFKPISCLSPAEWYIIRQFRCLIHIVRPLSILGKWVSSLARASYPAVFFWTFLEDKLFLIKHPLCNPSLAPFSQWIPVFLFPVNNPYSIYRFRWVIPQIFTPVVQVFSRVDHASVLLTPH